MRHSAPPATRDYNVIYIRIKTPSAQILTMAASPSLPRQAPASFAQADNRSHMYILFPPHKIKSEYGRLWQKLCWRVHVLCGEGRVTTTNVTCSKDGVMRLTLNRRHKEYCDTADTNLTVSLKKKSKEQGIKQMRR